MESGEREFGTNSGAICKEAASQHSICVFESRSMKYKSTPFRVCFLFHRVGFKHSNQILQSCFYTNRTAICAESPLSAPHGSILVPKRGCFFFSCVGFEHSDRMLQSCILTNPCSLLPVYLSAPMFRHLPFVSGNKSASTQKCRTALSCPFWGHF